MMQTSEGVLAGEARDGVRRFLGVPYAAPPVGRLRWRRPEEPQCWFGVRDAMRYSAAAIQPGPLLDDPLGGTPYAGPMFSEDCLYLNLYSPARRTDEKLPILVWMHGGGMVTGTAMNERTDGAALAKRGVIVAAINYRLGLFGFFCHPDLAAEADGCCGNYALWDVRQAVLWLRRNAEAFGGDPDNITVGGQSGGAVGSNCMLYAPPVRGLVRRIIVESGTCIHGMMQPKTRADMEREGAEFGAAIGCDSLAQLRGLDAVTLMRAAVARNFTPNFCVDGQFLPGMPQDLMRRGEFNAMDVLVGATGQEFAAHLTPDAISPERFASYVRDRYGALAEDVLAAYPHADSAEAGHSYHTLLGDLHFMGVVRTAELCHAFGRNCYAYYFDKNALGENGPLVGALHSGELPYLFRWEHHGGPELFGVYPWGEAEYRFSDRMVDWWANFIRTGDPGDGWKRADGRWDVLDLCDDAKMLGEAAIRRMEVAYRAIAPDIYATAGQFTMPGARMM